MKLRRLSTVLAGLLLTVGVAQADLTADFHGIKGNADLQSKAFLEKIDSVGFQWAGNDNIQIPYFKKFNDKNLDLLSFFTVTNLDVMRELLLANPDFGAYAPYNMLFYKKLDKDEKITWFGHLDADLMLKIIGEKDEANKKTFRDMVASLDTLAMKELKPTESKKLEYSADLPSHPLTKMVKKVDKIEDMEEFVDNFIEEHNGAFVKNEFIIAGFLDFKLEYDDIEADFDKYDAYWVSSLCHFKFSNSVFNHGEPQAGLFAPCSIYFYIPKGKNEIHVGYSQVGNWLATTGIKDEAMRKRILEIDGEVVDTFKSLGFELVEQGTDTKTTDVKKADLKKEEAPAKKETPVEKEEKKPEVKKEVTVDTTSCVGCHGAGFEKVALGKSKIVKDMSKADIENALKGYKDGSYGGAMKGVMKPNADKLSDEQIKAIAEKFGKVLR